MYGFNKKDKSRKEIAKMLDKKILEHCDKMVQNDWQNEYKYAGSFQTSLMQTIELADEINLLKIETVYPNLVRAYKKWYLSS